MIKKLQIKFVILSMSALLLVLSIIMVSINLVNYHSVIRDADKVLVLLSENQGKFPVRKGEKDMMGKELPPNMSPELPYESRYFSVSLNKNTGSVIQAETSRITSVDTSEAIAYAQEVIDSGRTGGFLSRFRYLVNTGTDSVQVIFLDCGRRLDSFRAFLLASVGISFAGYLVVFALIAFLSHRIIRPISESYEKQKRFITDAGHEIKTPLTIIHADADVLEMELGENEWLQDIQKQARRLTSLTNDLVFLARMEESSDSMTMIEFPVSDVISEACASFQALAQTQNKTLQCRIKPMLSLKGNEKAIQQLIHLLLDNALKYSPAGSTISLTLEKQNKQLILSVFNPTEQKIEKENLPQLFERFYRMDPSRNSQTGGHGIGLSVAKAIVTAHNGKIQARTTDGKSLLILVTFPL